MKMNSFLILLLILSMGLFEAEVEAGVTRRQLQEYFQCIRNIHAAVKSYTKITSSKVEQSTVEITNFPKLAEKSVDEYYTQNLEVTVEKYFCGYQTPELFTYTEPTTTNPYSHISIKEIPYLKLLANEDSILNTFLPSFIRKGLNMKEYCSDMDKLFNVIYVKYSAMLESSAFYNCYRCKSCDNSESASGTAVGAKDTVPETKTAETEENDMRFKCKQIFRFLTTFACKGTNVISRRINSCLEYRKPKSEGASQPVEDNKSPSQESNIDKPPPHKDRSLSGSKRLMNTIAEVSSNVSDKYDTLATMGSPTKKVKPASRNDQTVPEPDFQRGVSFNESDLFNDGENSEDESKFEQIYERLYNFQGRYENMEKAFFHCIIEDGKGKVECDSAQKKNLNELLESDLLEYFDTETFSKDAKKVAQDPLYTRTILHVYEETDIEEIKEKLKFIDPILEENLEDALKIHMESGLIAVDMLKSLKRQECEKNLSEAECSLSDN